MLKGRVGKKEGKREEEKEGEGGRERKKEGGKEGRKCSVAPSTGTIKVRSCFYFSAFAESV